MSSVTSIEWTSTHHPDGTVTPGRTWNPVRGCQIVSPGCKHCYAMKFAHRFNGPGHPYAGLTQITSGGPVWTGRVQLVPDALEEPLRWRKPCRVFVNSMSDLFHEDVPFEFISEVLKTCFLARRHTFQILTKRPERMLAYHQWTLDDQRSCIRLGADLLPNVWLGVSAEDQRRADERIPLLLQVPAAVRFVSCEPLLGPVDLRLLQHHDVPCNIDALGGRVWVEPGSGGACASLDWVIVGSESGYGARPMDEAWARSLRDQCVAANAAFFYKQRLESGRKVSTPELDGKTWTQFPEVQP